MSKLGSPVAVVVKAVDQEKSTVGEIRVQFWNKKERTSRALKFGSMCWGGAVVAVFIPGLHFILVPGLLIAGPIIALKVAAQESVVLGGECICPDCGKALPIARSPYRFPLSDLCTACQSAVHIDLLDTSSL